MKHLYNYEIGGVTSQKYRQNQKKNTYEKKINFGQYKKESSSKE